MRLLGSRIPALLLLILALALKLGEPRALQDLRLNVFDLYQRLLPRTYVEAGVRIVDIDDATLERVGQWPWSRLRVAQLVRSLTDLGVAAIGFDMVFAEPDRLSAQGVARDLEGLVDDPRMDRLTEALPASDAVLAEALARSPSVLGFVLVHLPTERLPMKRWGTGSAGDDPRIFLRPFSGAIVNLPELEAAAPGNGSFNAVPDADGIIRRVFLMFRLGDEIVPALSMELLRVAQGASTYLVKSSGSSGSESFGASTGVTAVKIGAIEAPTDAEGAIWLHFTGPRPERFVPAWQVLDGSVAPALLRNHIVLIGTSAAGLKDQRASPLDPAGPGVEVHAQALEQLLLGIRLVRPDWAVGAEFVFILLLGGVLVALMPKLSPGVCLIAGVLSLIIAFLGSFAAFREAGLLLDPLMPAGAVLLIYLAGSYSGYVRTEAERSRVRQAFSLYLAPEMVKTLARSSDRLQLGGELRELTVMFTDIRKFSSLSQRLTPTELTKVLNRFFTPMTELIQSQRGTIDKYIGDCIMAFWNAPLDDAEHAVHGCRAAIAMLRATRALEEELRREDSGLKMVDFAFRIGIGLNTGRCLVGNMGSQQRFNYSALGHDVNLAQRIEAQCKVYGIELLISESTAALAPGFAMLPVDRVLLPGAEQPVTLHALVGDEQLAVEAGFLRWRAAHEELLSRYRDRGFAEAAEMALEVRRLADDRHRPLYDHLRLRFLEMAASPPGPEWNGVTVSHEK
jgi:adenylate cyclase